MRFRLAPVCASKKEDAAGREIALIALEGLFGDEGCDLQPCLLAGGAVEDRKTNSQQIGIFSHGQDYSLDMFYEANRRALGRPG